MTYRCLQQKSFKENHYEIVPLRHEDIYSIKKWRNTQIEKPRQILFSFLSQSQCVGYGGLTHIDWDSKRAEVSFLLDPERAADEECYRSEFKIFLKLLFRAAFDALGLHRLYTETFDIRPLHIEVLESCGFRREGRLVDHNYIQGNYVDSVIHGHVKGLSDVVF